MVKIQKGDTKYFILCLARYSPLTQCIFLLCNIHDVAQLACPKTPSNNLTHVDLDELKGCLDLGFAFNYEEIPDLSNTLSALDLCYAISQKFQDDHH